MSGDQTNGPFRTTSARANGTRKNNQQDRRSERRMIFGVMADEVVAPVPTIKGDRC